MDLKNDDEIKIKVINQMYDGIVFRDINTFILQYGEEYEMNHIDILFKDAPDDIYVLAQATSVNVSSSSYVDIDGISI